MSDTLPRGVRLGVDVGDVRVGLARSDLHGMIATPVETLPRDMAVAGVVKEASESDTLAIMVGLPRKLDGFEGPAAQKARDFSTELVEGLDRAGLDVEVRLVDERLTTVDAHRALHSAGRKGRRHRSVVDQVAAVMILQNALDTERSTGRRTGEPVQRAPGGNGPAGADGPRTTPEDQP